MAALRISGITPHLAQSISSSAGSAIDGRTEVAWFFWTGPIVNL